MDLFPSGRQEGGGREMRSGLNTRGRGPGSGAWTPTAGSREPQPWREGSGRGGGAGDPGASRGVGPDRRSSQGCPLASAGSGRCSRGQRRGAMGMPPPGTKAQTSWCPADGKVPRRTYSGGPEDPGRGQPGPGSRAPLCPRQVGRGHEKPSSRDGDRPAPAGHPRTEGSLSGRAPPLNSLGNKAALSALASLPDPWAPPPGTEQSPHPGLPSGIPVQRSHVTAHVPGTGWPKRAVQGHPGHAAPHPPRAAGPARLSSTRAAPRA